MHMRRVIGLTVAAGGLLPAFTTGSQATGSALYRCAAETTVAAATVGVELCDAEPTPLLAERAEPDNLQIRGGALVVEVEDGGVAGVAGVQPGDMIYRVARADVPGAGAAAAGLAGVGTDSDTQINFLRRGRPYRIKLRR
ncbi:MAG: hypothetical protein OXG72_02875 [Acidobacteria bacterium]|nr:hypothetical protein [Acidobacteriota bacterium]